MHRSRAATDDSAENAGKRALQLEDNRPRSVMQKKQVDAMADDAPVQRRKNDTALPDQLKSDIENLSGHSMDDVKVHYNSAKPAQLNAHAYAQGTDIHIASGQEKHLPHEAWHVAQQKQGRVKPTTQMKGKVNINDDNGLEKEADMMGRKAIQRHAGEEKAGGNTNLTTFAGKNPITMPVQLLKVINYGSGTAPKTLMKQAHGADDQIENVDTGHMLLAEIIEKFLVDKKTKMLGGVVGKLLTAYASAAEKPSIEGMEESATARKLSWMKHEYFVHVDGVRGVMKEVDLMAPEARGLFHEKAHALASHNFTLGDSTTMPVVGDIDLIYCINGYGYSPLTDPNIFNRMYAALKPGGKLVIISELMGPTVKPFLQFGRSDKGELMKLFVLTREENVIKQNPDPRATMNIVERREVSHLISEVEPMSKAFDRLGKKHAAVPALGLFDYSQSSEIYVSKTVLLNSDLLTEGMESHHTEGGGQLDDVMHVRLEFIRK